MPIPRHLFQSFLIRSYARILGYSRTTSACQAPNRNLYLGWAALSGSHCRRSNAGARNGTAEISTDPTPVRWAPIYCGNDEHVHVHQNWQSRRSSSTSAPVTPFYELRLAQTGEGIRECELIKWFVQEGDVVESFQPVCQVQSDKASVDITSRFDGRVARLRFAPGELVKVGETLLELHVDEQPPMPSQLEEVASPIAPDAVVKPIAALATPAVRQVAKSMGLRIDDISGSGKEGRVMKEDVLRTVAERQGVLEEERQEETLGGGQPPKECRKVADVDVVIPLRGYRRSMAKTMTAANAVPHFYFMDEIEMGAMVKLKASLNAEGVRVTHMPTMVKALSQALLDHPILNGVVNEQVTEVRCLGAHNIGIAMATSGGLVVPSIKNCQSLSVLEIARELERLRHRAASNNLSEEELGGGTITISNVGTIGGTYAGPLINVPQVAIVALGRIRELPRFDREGKVCRASLMNVSWAADHRVVDGATLASFCQLWKHYLEVPESLLVKLK